MPKNSLTYDLSPNLNERIITEQIRFMFHIRHAHMMPNDRSIIVTVLQSINESAQAVPKTVCA